MCTENSSSHCCYLFNTKIWCYHFFQYIWIQYNKSTKKNVQITLAILSEKHSDTHKKEFQKKCFFDILPSFKIARSTNTVSRNDLHFEIMFDNIPLEI